MANRYCQVLLNFSACDLKGLPPFAAEVTGKGDNKLRLFATLGNNHQIKNIQFIFSLLGNGFGSKPSNIAHHFVIKR